MAKSTEQQFAETLDHLHKTRSEISHLPIMSDSEHDNFAKGMVGFGRLTTSPRSICTQIVSSGRPFLVTYGGFYAPVFVAFPGDIAPTDENTKIVDLRNYVNKEWKAYLGQSMPESQRREFWRARQGTTDLGAPLIAEHGPIGPKVFGRLNYAADLSVVLAPLEKMPASERPPASPHLLPAAERKNG